MSEFSRLDIHEGWAEIVIERHDRRNSLIPPLAGEICGYLELLNENDNISAIVLRGEGGYFCSGIDLKALQADPPPTWMGKDVGDVRSMHLALYRCKKPIIAALEKFAINAGASLAFACDLIVAGETAFLQIGEIQQGASIPMNAAWLKIKTTEFQAARLAFLGDRVLAPELLRRGLISECVSDNCVVERCNEIAETIAGYPAGAAIAIKQSLVAQRGIGSPEDFFPNIASKALNAAKMLKD